MNVISRNKRSLTIFVTVSLLIYLAFALALNSGQRINLTPSLPLGIYQIVPGKPAKGDLVSFCLQGKFAELARERGYLQAGSCPNGLRPLLKRLTGLPGNRILPEALTPHNQDSQGRPMPSVLRPGIIPHGMALVLADHPGSFDSRYFGFVPLDSLQRVEPVFIFSALERSTKPLNGEQSPPARLSRDLLHFAPHSQSISSEQTI